MSHPITDAPTPDLRIVLTDSLRPHEEHDSQRSTPLIERLVQDDMVINPPIVSPMGNDQYVILDGANRYFAFSHLHLPHILVQVAAYETGYVELKTWRHLVCNWDEDRFLHQLHALEVIQLAEGQHAHAIAHIMLRSGRMLAALAPVENTHGRNAALCDVVRIYQRQAVLQRTALAEPEDIWPLHPDAIAMVEFPGYQPSDIIAAARYQAYIPPGISRHIIHGRALRVNYPLSVLRDIHTSLQAKNVALLEWMQEKLAQRQIRYYAEATYQFDE